MGPLVTICACSESQGIEKKNMRNLCLGDLLSHTQLTARTAGAAQR